MCYDQGGTLSTKMIGAAKWRNAPPNTSSEMWKARSALETPPRVMQNSLCGSCFAHGSCLARLGGNVEIRPCCRALAPMAACADACTLHRFANCCQATAKGRVLYAVRTERYRPLWQLQAIEILGNARNRTCSRRQGGRSGSERHQALPSCAARWYQRQIRRPRRKGRVSRLSR